MDTNSIIIDDFLPDFGLVRQWVDIAKFEDVTNPVDGVMYPDICLDTPADLFDNVMTGVEEALGWPAECRQIFMRRSLAGGKAPHQAHTDASMGQFSLMLYMNRAEHCQGGTSLLRNRETGEESNPTDAYGEAVWKRDTNLPWAWDKTAMCAMKPNRAFIFKADLYHRAEPIGGFGTNSLDGRIVLTMFFDKGKS